MMNTIRERLCRLRKAPDLEGGPLAPLILRFALPAVFSYFISELYNMVDTYYVGNYVGRHAIGALGAVFPIQRVVIALSLLFAFATANTLAFHQGEKDLKQAAESANTGIMMNFWIMIPYTLLVFAFRAQLLPVLGARGVLFEPALDYVTIIIWGSIFLTLSTTMARILLTIGHAGLSVVLTSLGALINIVLDDYLVVHLHMGVHGAAFATLVSQVGCFLVTLIFYIRLARQKHLHFRVVLNWKRSLRLFSIGLPSFIVESEDAVVMAVLNILLFRIAAEDGVSVLAMNTKVYMFLFVLILGFAYGMQTIVAYNFGAKNTERVRKTIRLTLIMALGASLASTALFYIFAEGLLGIFVKDADMIALCAPTFRHMIIGLPLLSVYYVTVMYYQAKGAARASIMLTLLRQILILMPLALLMTLVFKSNLNSIFYAYPITDVLAALIAGILLHRERNTAL